MSAKTPALELRGLNAGYGRGTAIRDLRMTVPSGSTLALLGANGAGKTTTLRTISGLLRPKKGSILLHGTSIGGRSPWEIARMGLGHVPEGRGIFPSLTVAKNLQLTRFAVPGATDGLTDEMATLFPRLVERHSQLAGTLSGGEQQMLAVARVLQRSPGVVLFDELSLGLSPALVRELFDVVDEVRRRGTTVVLVEQFVHEALRLADYVAILARGEMMFFGEAGELAEGDSEEILAGYLGG